MSRLLYVLLGLFLLPFTGRSQVETIFLEDFSSVPDGTGFTGPSNNPVTIGQGTANLNGAVLLGSSGRFAVSIFNMEASLTTSSIKSGEVTWQTGPIDISCYSDISFSIDASGNDDLNATFLNIGGGDDADYIAIDVTLVETAETFTRYQKFGAFARETITIQPSFINICGGAQNQHVIFTVRFYSDKMFESHSLYSLRVFGESTEARDIIYDVNCDSGIELQVDASTGCVTQYSLNGVDYNTTGQFAVSANTPYTIYIRDQYFPLCETTVDVFVTAGCEVVLPIELIQFTGAPEGENILLQWETATELNNDFMAVEHSIDGISFREIGKVRGAGTTSEPQFYQFLDRQPVAGSNYYRLRQVDFDGTTAYHEIIVVEMTGREKLPTDIRLYPTVTNEQIRVAIGFKSQRPMPYLVYSLLGQLVKSGEIASESDQLELNVTDLPSGTYLFSIRHQGQTFTRRFFRSED